MAETEPTVRQLYEAARRGRISRADERTFEEWKAKVSDYGLDDARQAFYEGRREVVTVTVAQSTLADNVMKTIYSVAADESRLAYQEAITDVLVALRREFKRLGVKVNDDKQ